MTAFEKSFRSRCADTRTHMTVSDEGEGCLVLDCSGFHIPGGDLGAFAADLARAAGKPEPVILVRPAGEPDRFRGIKATRDGWTVLLSIGGNRDALDASAARDLAARIAILADEAEDEPDPAEVGELAALMDAEMERRACGQSGLYPAVARIALQWMNGRRQRGGQP